MFFVFVLEHFIKKDNQMLTFTHNNETFKIVFRHQYGILRESNPTSNHHITNSSIKYPKSTHCFIKNLKDEIVSEGRAKPAYEIPVILKPGENAEKLYKNRLKKVLRTDDNTRIAIIRGDMFNYKDGRRESAKKALNNLCLPDIIKTEVLNQL